MDKGLELRKNKRLEYFIAPALEETGLVKHCFSTRLGGYSVGGFESLNLGITSKDATMNIVANYKVICDEIGVDTEKLQFPRQVHGDNIGIITKEQGITSKTLDRGIDGLITNLKGVPLVTFFADCVPVLLLDINKKVIATIHSGWRGTVKKITLKGINLMCEKFGSNPSDIIAVIGPSIGQCCYEVDEKVYSEFKKSFPKAYMQYFTLASKGHYMLDLWKAVTDTLKSGGILEDNITASHLCTQCNELYFYSHRRQGAERGTLAAILELR
jgi:YfiH family protein